MRLLLSTLFILASFGLQAQTPTEQTQHLYLKDGTYLLGQVIQQTVDTVYFQTTYGAVQAIPQEVVSLIEMTTSRKTYFKKGKGVQVEGWYGYLDLQFLLGQEENPWSNELEPRLGLAGSGGVGYQFNRYLSTDFDLSLNVYNSFLVGAAALGVRSYILTGPVSPFVRVQGGYGISLVDNPNFNEFGNSGWLVHPSVGLRFASKGNSEFHIDCGYRFQRLNVDGGWFQDKITFQRLSLRFGLLF